MGPYLSALLVESVHSVGDSALVVTAEDVDVLGELDLIEKDQGEAEETVLPSVHEVAEEYVARLTRVAATLEHLLHKVLELPVDVAHHCALRLDSHNVVLILEDCACPIAQCLHLVCRQRFLRCRAVPDL